MKTAIKFNGMADEEEFVAAVDTLKCDVNLYDGRNVFDAKSIMALMNLDLSKTFKVEVVTDDKQIKKQFEEIVKKYEA